MKSKLILPLSLLLFLVFSCKPDMTISSSKSALNSPREGDILWQKNDLGENLESGPAVDNRGNVYVIGNGIVYSYTADGTFRWSTKTSPGDGCTPSVSPDNAVVYTCGIEGVYALNASNGNQIWHSSVDKFHTVPCVSADGSRIYIASDDLGGSGTIYALNASDGSTAWSYHPREEDGFMGGIALDTNGNLLVPGQNAYLYSLRDNESSFSVNWTFHLGAEARQPVTVGGDGYIYATSNTGVVHKINAATGKEDTSGNWPALGGIGEVFASMAFSPDGDTLYVNAEDYKLHALNTDGSEKWTFTFEMWGSDPLVRDDGRIIVMGQIDGAARVCCLSDNGSSAVLEWSSEPICNTLRLNETNVNIGPDGTLFVHSGDQPPLGLFAIQGNGMGLSTKSPWPKYMGNIRNNGNPQNIKTKPVVKEGDILWQRSAGENVESTPAVDSKSNVYTAGGRSVYSYAADGKHRWTIEVGEQAGEFNSPSISPDEKVVYGGGVNFVYALNSATGQVLWKNTDFDVGFHSVPAVSSDGSRLYFGVGAERDEGESFYCIDTSDGSVKWEYVMPHPPRGFHGYLGGAINGSDGTIYVASQHGWLISLTDNGDSFTENWAYDVKAEMRMPPSMDSDGYLYVGSSDAGGYVHKVDSRTGKSAGGNWPVKTTAGEVFTHISIGADGTLYINSEDRRLWAFYPDGTVKWNNIKFEMWGSDPLVRNDGKIIVGSQINGAARVACIRDNGDSGTIEWTSEPIAKTLHLNETNVNIAPDGTIFITTGQPDMKLGEQTQIYALKGNGQGLSTKSPWPKYMGNIRNNGNKPHF